MEVRSNLIVHLGYGKYVRSDKIVSLEPIEEGRGPGRRTRVYVEGQERPLIASRTEETVLRDMVELPEEVVEARAALGLLEDLLSDLEEVGPMLRHSIRQEADLDLDHLEQRIRRILGNSR